MPQVPQHPGRQQGLGAPVANEQSQGVQNPYFVPSVPLEQYNANKTGQAQLQQAQAAQAGAQAGKAQAESEILGALAQSGLGGNPLQAGPQVQPQQVQAEQVADGIIRGQVGQGQLQAMVQAGEIDPSVAEAAMGMAQQFLQQDQVNLEQSQGLGAIQ